MHDRTDCEGRGIGYSLVMLDALRTGEDERATPRLSADYIEDVARELGLTRSPLDMLALSWALGRGDLGAVEVGES